jgi:hypothetical protein
MGQMRRLTGYLLLFLALGSSLPGIAFLLFGLAIGLDVRITEPPLVLIGGVAMTVLMFWGAQRLLSPQPQGHSVTD